MTVPPRVRPLDGMKVLDLTHVLAGPYCTYQLALLGADVVKVEPLRGEMIRGWGGTPEQMAMGLGTGFVPQNASKRAIAVDLATDGGRAIVARMAEDADIVVENYRPGTTDGHGLDFDTVRRRNPSVIYATISAFGHEGPHADRPGFDDVIQATSGYMTINVRGDGPIRTGGPVLDYSTGLHAASAILAAVVLQMRTGEAQHVDVAMQDVAMLLINRNTSIAATTGAPVAPAGNRDGVLLGRYATKDGHVMLAGYRARHQQRICRALGLTEFEDLSGHGFAERGADVDAAAEAVLATRTSAEWDDVFAAEGVVGGGVRDLSEVLATGQPAARQFLTEVPTATGPVTVTTGGYLVNGSPFTPTSGVPLIGEHTVEVLGELGYDDAVINGWLADGVVAQSTREA